MSLQRRGHNATTEARTHLRQPVLGLPPVAVRRVTVGALSRPDLLALALRQARSDKEAFDAVCRVLHISPGAAAAVVDQLDGLRARLAPKRPVPGFSASRRRRPIVNRLMCRRAL